MTSRGLAVVPPAGTVVRMTGHHLRSTGQIAGGEGQSRWLTLACACGLCAGGGFVAVNEEHEQAYRLAMWGDLPESERPRYRHIAIANLQIVGARPKAGDQP
jgi:hypothetical protein